MKKIILKFKNRLVRIGKQSYVAALISSLKNDLVDNTIQLLSIITGIALIINLILSLFICRKIILLDWFIQGALLVICAIGLNSRVRWQDIRESSLFIKYLKKHCKNY